MFQGWLSFKILMQLISTREQLFLIYITANIRNNCSLTPIVGNCIHIVLSYFTRYKSMIYLYSFNPMFKQSVINMAYLLH